MKGTKNGKYVHNYKTLTYYFSNNLLFKVKAINCYRVYSTCRSKIYDNDEMKMGKMAFFFFAFYIKQCNVNFKQRVMCQLYT